MINSNRLLLLTIINNSKDNFYSANILTRSRKNYDLMKIIAAKYNFPILSKNNKINILNYHQIDKFILKGYFIFKNSETTECIAVSNMSYLLEIVKLYPKNVIYLIGYEDFLYLIEANFNSLNTIKAKYFLNFISPLKSARNVPYIKIFVIFNSIFFVILTITPNLFLALNNLFYFSQNCLKFFLMKRALGASNIYPKQYQTSYPIYSVLVPLYKEAAKLFSIIKAIKDLDYPQKSLDVKIIIEEDDNITLSALYKFKAENNFPGFIQIIKVPFSLPRTKPKALNYALSYCYGEYIVVYDAEDRPDKDQLIKALQSFQTLPQDYACLQAKLNFYNSNENILSLFFSIEYCLWFNYLLKGLSLLGLPIPLGGTSNHFKKYALCAVGMWDSYNVTEDADLGIRLYNAGFKTALLESYTFEEAPTDLNNWINQRSRWIKGYIQTFLVFLRSKNINIDSSFSASIIIYIFMGISSYSFFVFPFLITMLIKNQNKYMNYLWLINSFFAFAYIYACSYYILAYNKKLYKNKVSTEKKTIFYNIKTKLKYYGPLIIFPCYFLLHVISCYKAIWELIFNPFNWNKTRHGTSKYEI